MPVLPDLPTLMRPLIIVLVSAGAWATVRLGKALDLNTQYTLVDGRPCSEKQQQQHFADYMKYPEHQPEIPGCQN